MTIETYNRAMALRKIMFPLQDRSKATHDRILSKLLEEGGETAGAANTFFGRKYRPDLEPGNVEKIKGELGDLFFVLLGLCEFWETTPDECMEMVIEKLQGRKEVAEANGQD
jgi:NTP pyrophosphatase (non-canonical NTP hydrolase)